MGRKPSGSKLVEGMEGSELAKARVGAILDCLSGRKKIEEATEDLGIEQAMFFRMRSEALKWAVAALEPKPMGRPRKERTLEEEEIETLKLQIKRLELERDAAQIREEIALAMPHLRKAKKADSPERR
jgi:hypothetical protein